MERQCIIPLVMLCMPISVYCSENNDVRILVSADKLKGADYTNGRSNSIKVDLNSDGYTDALE